MPAASDTCKDPHLGLATTGKLIDELLTRFAITTPNPKASHYIELALQEIPKRDQEYRTVGH